MDITILVIWLLAGIINLLSREVSKISYFLTWACLMFALAEKYLN